MAHEGQYWSPLELITQNVKCILADVLNKLECGDVDHSIDFATYRVEFLCSALVNGLQNYLFEKTKAYLELSDAFAVEED